MFILYADKNKLALRRREPLTSGSVNVYETHFEFSADWDGLAKTAVFRAGGEPVAMPLGESGACQIPPEVLAKSGVHLRVGVYGTYGGDVVLPTVWVDCGYILEGVSVRPSMPELWEQALAQKQDKLTGRPGQMVGFDTEGSAVAVDEPVYEFGHGLKQDGGTISVSMSSKDNPDKSLPISAAAVEAAVGNIEIMLQTI